uniref:Uncharacterized protein n=1 Tax=Megaselia scalaris TaxID=36166 RepID=T1GDF0_MEGSC
MLSTPKHIAIEPIITMGSYCENREKKVQPRAETTAPKPRRCPKDQSRSFATTAAEHACWWRTI